MPFLAAIFALPVTAPLLLRCPGDEQIALLFSTEGFDVAVQLMPDVNERHSLVGDPE